MSNQEEVTDSVVAQEDAGSEVATETCWESPTAATETPADYESESEDQLGVPSPNSSGRNMSVSPNLKEGRIGMPAILGASRSVRGGFKIGRGRFLGRSASSTVAGGSSAASPASSAPELPAILRASRSVRRGFKIARGRLLGSIASSTVTSSSSAASSDDSAKEPTKNEAPPKDKTLADNESESEDQLEVPSPNSSGRNMSVSPNLKEGRIGMPAILGASRSVRGGFKIGRGRFLGRSASSTVAGGSSAASPASSAPELPAILRASRSVRRGFMIARGRLLGSSASSTVTSSSSAASSASSDDLAKEPTKNEAPPKDE